MSEMNAPLANKDTPLQITEDEAAVYDRQIRLWGIEAQQRMRNATILVFRLKGTATETIKNLVLAGVGKLIFVDGENVAAEDLGTGFFFRDGDVGKKRVEAAKARIQNLNPLVTVDTVLGVDFFDVAQLGGLIQDVDLICTTDLDRDSLLRVNEVCRRLSKPFYAGGTFGLLGYIFSDLLNHDYVASEKVVSKGAAAKNVKVTMSYSSLSEALQYKWTSLSKRDTKRLKPEVVVAILGLWEYQSRHGGKLPGQDSDLPTATQELENICNQLITDLDMNTNAISSIPSESVQSLAENAPHELSPVCAVVGGMLAQDILKALAAREPPIANFFVFNGVIGGATVCRLGMP